MTNITAMGQLRNANKILKVSNLGMCECRSKMDMNGRVCKDMDSSENKSPVMGSLEHNNDSAESIRDMEFP